MMILDKNFVYMIDEFDVYEILISYGHSGHQFHELSIKLNSDYCSKYFVV